MKKIALCLSGFPRNYKNTFPYLKKHFLDLNDVDVFFEGLNQKIGVIDQQVIDLYRPKKYNFSDYDQNRIDTVNREYGNYPIQNNCGAHENKLKSQFYNVNKSNLLRIAYEQENNIKYDIVFRCRPDCYFFKDLVDEDFNMCTDENVVIPSDWDFPTYYPHAKTDGFAYSTPTVLDKYSSAFYSFGRYNTTENVPFHPESLLGHHLHKNEIVRIHRDRCIRYETPNGIHDERRQFE